MRPSQYFDIIETEYPLNQKTIGRLIGKGIRDPDIKPSEFDNVCKTAKKRGFKFANIELTVN